MEKVKNEKESKDKEKEGVVKDKGHVRKGTMIRQ